MGTSKLEDKGLLVIELGDVKTTELVWGSGEVDGRELVDSVSEVDVAELLNIELDTTKVVGLVNS